MNKADKLCILIVVICSLLFYIPLYWMHSSDASKEKEVVVSYKNEEVLRVRLDKDATYKVKGSMGLVLVEIKDGQVRVEKETSPQHLCSIQGWVKESTRPIVCLPNNIVVQIETMDEDSDVDAVIQ